MQQVLPLTHGQSGKAVRVTPKSLISALWYDIGDPEGEAVTRMVACPKSDLNAFLFIDSYLYNEASSLCSIHQGWYKASFE